MKSIELTKKHKSKLLEMCKDLFPEMFAVNIQENGYLNYSEKGKKINYEDKIHWFEFCINWLAISIYNKGAYNFNYITITQFRGYICQEVDHTIDYLYEEFKKLKK